MCNNQHKNMTAMLNNFKVKPDCDFIRLSTWVNYRALDSLKVSPLTLMDLCEKVKNDKHLKKGHCTTPYTKKLRRMWDNINPADRSVISYGADVKHGDKRLSNFWCQEVKHNPTYDEIQRLQRVIEGSVEATFKICGVSHQVLVYLHSLPNLKPYKATLDLEGYIGDSVDLESPNCWADYTCSISDKSLLPKMVELLMIAEGNITHLYVYNLYTGTWITYIIDWKNPESMRLKRKCEDYYHQMLELRNKQEWENKI